MPTYDFACDACGPFELWRDAGASGAPADCQGCGGRARRLYVVPMMRSPGDRFGGESREVRARVERSHTGEPAVTLGPSRPGRPLGPALHAGGHGHHGHGGAKPPWLIGH